MIKKNVVNGIIIYFNLELNMIKMTYISLTFYKKFLERF
jgi:hypothetical protein